MPRKHSLAAAAALALLAGGLSVTSARADTSPGADLYVNDGSAQCSNAGPGTQAEPFCSIQSAANVAVAGQTVHIYELNGVGGYAPFTISHSGTAGHPITFEGDPASGQPATTLVSVIGESGPGVTVSGASDVDLANLAIENRSGNGPALDIAGGHDITVTNGEVDTAPASPSTTSDDIDIDGTSSDVTITRSSLFLNSGWGLNVQSGATGIVATADVLRNDGVTDMGGIHADGVNGITITNDTINAYCGSAVDLTGSSQGSIENTVAVNAGSRSPARYCAGDGPSAEINVAADSAPTVTSDYNALGAGYYGSDYVWGGTAYTTPQAFTAATTTATAPGQGAHDLGGITDAEAMANPENSPLIDSANADAPLVPALDYNGNPRVDDPLVANTGTGDGYVDRGAVERQNPLQLDTVKLSPAEGPAPLPVVASVPVNNPWDTQGVLYSFNFGDGTGATPPSSEPTANHTYAATGSYGVTVTATLPDGTVRTEATSSIQVNAPGPLTPVIDDSITDEQPDSVDLWFPSTSPWAITNNVVDFGDKSGAQQTPGTEGQLAHTYPAPGTYTVTDTVTDAGGRTATTSEQVTVGLAFVGITPVRVLDTRYGTGAPKGPVGPGSVTRVRIEGVDGIPQTGVSAVTLNLTDTHATASSWVTAYADGSARPSTSALNFGPGQTNPNLVTVPVATDGSIDLWNANGSTDLFADVQGYYTSRQLPNATQTNFSPTTPTRVLDTRYGTGAPKKPVGPGGTLTLTLPPAAGNDQDVVLNVTETGATSGGYITVYPGTGARPTASNLNFGRGQTTSNLVVVPLAASGTKTVNIYNSAGDVNLFADVQGYYSDSDSGTTPYVPVTPTRVVDTRYGTGAPQRPISPGADLRVKVAGTAGVPLGADSVLINLTGTRPTAGTWLTAFASGTAPNASNLDLLPGQTRPVLAVVPVDPQGYITIQNARGNTDVFADIEGYFA